MNSSLLGASAINHSVPAAVLSRGSRPGSSPLGAAAESHKPALIFFAVGGKKWMSESEDTRKKGSPVCPIYALK